MTDATPEQMDLARKIVAQHYFNIRDPDYAGWVLKGAKDGATHIQIALAAIIETTERAAKLVEEFGESRSIQLASTSIRAEITKVLRNGEHLK